MIPVMIINESGESFNYFEGRITIGDTRESTPKLRYKIYHNDAEIFGANNLFLRDKVLELLHKEVAGCFIYNINRAVPPGSPLIQQYRFQIYLKDVIQKAKGEGK